MQPPTTTLLAQEEKVTHLGVARIRRTFKTEVPYCEACKDHALEHERARPGQVFLGAFGVLILVAGAEYCVGSCAVRFLPPLAPAPSGGANPVGLTIFVIGALLPWLLAGTFLVRGLLHRPPEVTCPPHATPLRAVEVHDFTDQSHTLVLHNAEFWRRCIEANADQVEAKG